MDLQTACKELYYKVHENMKDSQQRPVNAIEFIRLCMVLVDEFPIAGSIKSQACIFSLTKFAHEQYEGFKNVLTSQILDHLRYILDNDLIQPIMDAIYKASKGEISFGGGSATANSSSLAPSEINITTRKLELRSLYSHILGM